MAVDWVAFSYMPTSTGWKKELAELLGEHFGTKGWEPGRGWQGYEQSAKCGVCLVAWGGAAQQGTVHVEIPGSVCAAVIDWRALVVALEAIGARLTRVDIAGDDYDGTTISIGGFVDAHRAGLFTNGGRPPSAKLIDDLGSGAGSTLYVGKRENGKLLRVYEKGRQLGASDSSWVRAEVEWRAKDRVLPFEMLLDPVRFLAGAYGPLAFFSSVVSIVRAFKERARISYKRAVEIARMHAGRVVNAILTVTGGDVARVVELLRRDGFPARLTDSEARFLSYGGVT